MYHLRIVHLGNVKEVAPSKWLISKALISLFFSFWIWFHYNIGTFAVPIGHINAPVCIIIKEMGMQYHTNEPIIVIGIGICAMPIGRIKVNQKINFVP